MIRTATMLMVFPFATQGHDNIEKAKYTANAPDVLDNMVYKLAIKMVNWALKAQLRNNVDLDDTTLAKAGSPPSVTHIFDPKTFAPRVRTFQQVLVPRSRPFQPRLFSTTGNGRSSHARREASSDYLDTYYDGYEAMEAEAAVAGAARAARRATRRASQKKREARKPGKSEADKTRAWKLEKIDSRVSIQNNSFKGRCLFSTKDCKPGQVVFAEKPVYVVMPSLAPKLWENLTSLYEAEDFWQNKWPYFAALMSLFHLDQPEIEIILDKFIPDEDVELVPQVSRVLSLLSEDLKGQRKEPIDPYTLQRLASAWHYSSVQGNKKSESVLFDRFSMCAHSCDPSCSWSFGDAYTLVLRALRPLRKGDELTISYIMKSDLKKTTKERRKILKDIWHFVCACERCAPPSGTRTESG